MKLKTLAFATLMAFGGAAFAQAPATGAARQELRGHFRITEMAQ